MNEMTDPTLPDLTTLPKLSSPAIPTKLTTSSATTTSSSYRTTLLRDGYVVIPNLLPPHLLLASQASSKYLVSNTRTGTYWPHVRTTPKQFPPWPPNTPGTNIWGIQHLLHPSLTGLRDVFAEVYFSEHLLAPVREILSTDSQPISNDDLVMELFNLLISPAGEDFELFWHRDDVRPELTGEDEMRELNCKAPDGRQVHAQYNVALFEDESLVVVPGSHRRVRSEEERVAKTEVLEGEVRVKLEPGDAVFYDSNVLHRGVYRGIDVSEEMGRMTLHGSVGLKGFGGERARQVLQHGVGWAEGGEFENIQDEEKKMVAETMRRNLVEMGQGRGEVGYSLEG